MSGIQLATNPASGGVWNVRLTGDVRLIRVQAGHGGQQVRVMVCCHLLVCCCDRVSAGFIWFWVQIRLDFYWFGQMA